MSLPERFDQRLLQLRVITIALAGGAAVFLGIAFFLSQREEFAVERGGPPFLTYVALVLAMMALTGRATLPRLLERAGRRQIREGKGIRGGDAEERLATLYQSRVILCAALLESAALMGGVAFMLEKSPLGMAAAGVCIAAILLWEFPSRSTMGTWLEAQTRLLNAGE